MLIVKIFHLYCPYQQFLIYIIKIKINKNFDLQIKNIINL